VRIIGGSARGVPLKGPPTAQTRPTSDKVRGAIFNMLAPHIVDARVLDLFAGTGALGIEALSRGATSCLFVEQSRAVCRVIDANLAAARLSTLAEVWCCGVSTALDRLGAAAVKLAAGEGGVNSTFMPPYDVILLDPPYASADTVSALNRISSLNLLAGGGMVVLEHGKRSVPSDHFGDLILVRTRLYGDTAVSLFQHAEHPASGDDVMSAQTSRDGWDARGSAVRTHISPAVPGEGAR